MERMTAILEQDTFVREARDTVRAMAIAAAVMLVLLVATGAAALAGYGAAAFLLVAATGALFGLALAVEGVTSLLRSARIDVPTLGAGRKEPGRSIDPQSTMAWYVRARRSSSIWSKATMCCVNSRPTRSSTGSTQ